MHISRGRARGRGRSGRGRSGGQGRGSGAGGRRERPVRPDDAGINEQSTFRVGHRFKFVYWNSTPPGAERNLLVYKITGTLEHGYIDGIVDRTNQHGQFWQGYGSFHRHMIGQVRQVNLRASDRVPRGQRLNAVVAPVPVVPAPPAPSAPVTRRQSRSIGVAPCAPASSGRAPVTARTPVIRRHGRGSVASGALSSAHTPMHAIPAVPVPPAVASHGPVTRRRARMNPEHQYTEKQLQDPGY